MIRKILALVLLLTAPALAQTQPARPPHTGTLLNIATEPTLKDLTFLHITADIDNINARQSIAEFNRTSPVPLNITTPFPDMDQQPVTIHVKDVPFIEGLMQFRDQTHTTLRNYSPESITLAYANTDDGMPLWSVAGPFAITLQGITRDISFPATRPGRAPAATAPTVRATLQMGFLAEPGVNVIQSLQTITFDTFEDEKHQPLTATPPARGTLPGQGGMLSLTLPANPGRRIPLLTGHASATLTKTERAESLNLADVHTQTINGITIEIQPLVPRNNSTVFFIATVKFSRGDCPPEKWAELSPMFPRVIPIVRTTSARGTATGSSPAPSLIKRDADSVTIPFAITVGQGAGRAATLAIDVPVELRQLSIPFEFHDVIIP